MIWVEVKIQPSDRVSGDAGDVDAIVAVIRDVSERKAQERAIEIARSESERANAAKSRFLANMSHELRTPLNAIIGFSEILTDESALFDPTRKLEYAKLINSSGRHLLSVVNGILEMSRLETGNFEIVPERFAPAEAITNCCDLFALKARESGVHINVRLAQDLPELMADRRAFNQIMINLISNAIKFTPQSGNVTVSAHREGINLVAVVEDSGMGIDEDDLPRIGEAFFQAHASADRKQEGTGLGLSIVKGLVQLHDGDIDISSRPGKGTRVVVRLPVDGEADDPPVHTTGVSTDGIRKRDTMVRVKQSA